MTWPTDRAVVGELITAADVNLLPVLIASSTLGGSAANIDLTGLPTIYASLMVVAWLRGDTAATSTAVNLRFNNDSAANYDYQYVLGSGATPSAGEAFGQTAVLCGSCSAASAPASVFTAYLINVPHYANAANNKAVSVQTALKTGTASGNLQAINLAGFWRSNTAISRLTFLPGAGNFVTGSRVSVYGMGQ